MFIVVCSRYESPWHPDHPAQGAHRERLGSPTTTPGHVERYEAGPSLGNEGDESRGV